MTPEELGERLKAIREARRLRQEDVAKLLGVTRVLISHWERGERRPSEGVLERLASIYGLSLRQLLEGEPIPEQDVVELLYRDAEGGIDTAARAGLQEFVQFLETYADLLGQLDEDEHLLRQSPFRLHRGFTSRDDIRRKARDVREWLGLGQGPIADLPGLLDELGVTLYRVALGSDLRRSVSGAFLNHPRLGFCVAVNLQTTPGRQVFTMSHELAHALFHSHTEHHVVSYFGRHDEKERFADQWAGEFLVPIEGLRRAVERFGIKTVTNPTEVVHLQRFFQVSYGMMLLRLLQSKLVTLRAYEELKTARPVALASRLGYDVDTEEWSQDPTRWRLERFPRQFVRLLTDALERGVISPPTAASLSGLTLDEITELIAPVSGGDPDVLEELSEYEDVRERAAG